MERQPCEETNPPITTRLTDPPTFRYSSLAIIRYACGLCGIVTEESAQLLLMAWRQATLNHHVDVSQPVAVYQEGQANAMHFPSWHKAQ